MTGQALNSGAIDFDQSLTDFFGSTARMTPLVSADRMGRRIHNIDLSKPLSEQQARLLVALLDQFNILTFPDQPQPTFRLRYLERLTNYFGAPITHPKNYANYAEFAKTGAPLRLLARAQQTASLCNLAFPGQLSCVEDAESPAVFVVTNLVGSGADRDERFSSGLHWHTDIEFEQIPLSTSLFYVQSTPTTREAPGGTWVPDVPPDAGFYHPDSTETLNCRRLNLPLNGGTAYTDTTAAFYDLPALTQTDLENTLVRRRLRASDPGWLTPLVYKNPRTGSKSLHSPVWASRGKNVAPVEVDGLSERESREFLDELEAHVLQPKYRYDHTHQPGDITIWSNFSTLHNAPPAKTVVNKVEDARLMYRLSCKGDPCYRLPREDTDEWINQNIHSMYRTPLNWLE